MNPELVFSGYDVSQYADDINKNFTANDFSTDAMYDAYGTLAEIKREFENKSDEEIIEFIKTAPADQVQHFINLGFVNQ